MGSIPVKDEDHWRALRQAHVGSSDIAALFGVSPWTSIWRLWHEKRGTLPHDEGTEVMRAGQHFEPAIASYAQEKWDLRLRKVRRYFEADDSKGLGSSLDYEEFGAGEFIPTELKFAFYSRDQWEFDGDIITDAPIYYLLQVQAQLACTGASRAQLIAWLDGTLRRMVIEPRPVLIAAIKERVAEFWDSIDKNIEPPFDKLADTMDMASLAAASGMKTLDLSDNEAFRNISGSYHMAKAELKKWEETAQNFLGDAVGLVAAEAKKIDPTGTDRKIVAIAKPYKLSITTVSGKPATIITSDMIGETFGGRSEFTKVTLSKKKEKTDGKTTAKSS